MFFKEENKEIIDELLPKQEDLKKLLKNAVQSERDNWLSFIRGLIMEMKNDVRIRRDILGDQPDVHQDGYEAAITYYTDALEQMLKEEEK